MDYTKTSHWFCAECGSKNILHDATAKYDYDKDDYVVVGVQDGMWCEDCIEETGGDSTGDPSWGLPYEEVVSS